MKKTVHIDGKIAFPLEVGRKAVIYRGGDFLFTSLVVEIQEYRPDYACFETLNSIYKVSLAPVPVELETPCQLARAA